MGPSAEIPVKPVRERPALGGGTEKARDFRRRGGHGPLQQLVQYRVAHGALCLGHPVQHHPAEVGLSRRAAGHGVHRPAQSGPGGQGLQAAHPAEHGEARTELVRRQAGVHRRDGPQQQNGRLAAGHGGLAEGVHAAALHKQAVELRLHPRVGGRAHCRALLYVSVAGAVQREVAEKPGGVPPGLGPVLLHRQQ